MTDVPMPLDNLIAYVKELHGDGNALANLSEAVTVGSRLNEQADALIGHFVDRARRSGASWSKIGASMGVTKQAAQKRFVLRWDDVVGFGSGRPFSRFTPRARYVVQSALATATVDRAEEIDVRHLVDGLMTEPQGMAAVVVHAAGVTDEQIRAAFVPSLGAMPRPDDDGPIGEDRLPFSDAAKSALEATLHAALRLGHSYIGTEHLLLGILAETGDASIRLNALGVQRDDVERRLTEELAKLKAAQDHTTPPA